MPWWFCFAPHEMTKVALSLLYLEVEMLEAGIIELSTHLEAVFLSSVGDSDTGTRYMHNKLALRRRGW